MSYLNLPLDRRLCLAATAVLVVLAGCSGGGGGGLQTGTTTAAPDTQTTMVEGEDGPTAMTTTPSPTPTPTTIEKTGSPTPSATTTTQTNATGLPRFGELDLAHPDSYRFRFTVQSSGVSVKGRFHGSDFRYKAKTSKGTVIQAAVGGTTYVILQDRCYSSEEASQYLPDINIPRADPSGDENPFAKLADVRASGITTVDGEPVYVFDAGNVTIGKATLEKLYVSVEEHTIRRMVTEQADAYYWDWGSAPPVTKPC